MKRIKYLGINLPKGTKDLYTENYKTLIILYEKIKDDTSKWKNTPCSWIGIINTMKISITLKAIIDSAQNLSN